MRKLCFIFLVLASSIAFASNQAFLFIQKSERAAIKKNENGSYTLTLKKVPQYLSYFSNRPEREAGIVSLKKFLAAWSDSRIKNNFAEDPPNVALAMVTKTGKVQNVVGTLSMPVYTENTLVYSLKPLHPILVETGDLSSVDIFFDDIHWNPGGFGN